ncbi:MAG TPA: PDZ domain-containing protein [Roseiarcus sp.]|nr:PDZ domain-containing protein [Roseiarcus sp.]
MRKTDDSRVGSPRALLGAVAVAALVCGNGLLIGHFREAHAETIAPLERHKALGFMAAPVPPGSKETLRLAKDRGMIVVAVTPGGLADRAGLRKGDVILSVDGRPIASQADLDSALNSATAARKAVAEVSRQGAILSIAFGL